MDTIVVIEKGSICCHWNTLFKKRISLILKNWFHSTSSMWKWILLIWKQYLTQLFKKQISIISENWFDSFQKVTFTHFKIRIPLISKNKSDAEFDMVLVSEIDIVVLLTLTFWLLKWIRLLLLKCILLVCIEILISINGFDSFQKTDFTQLQICESEFN